MSKGNLRRNLVRTTALAGSLCFTLLAGEALARPQTYNFDMPAQSLSASLREYARVSGQQIIFTDDLVAGHRAPALRGDYSADAALNSLLAGSDLIVERTPSGAIMVRKKNEKQAAVDEGNDESSAVETVTVTGTRIAGTSPTSATITITRTEIEREGHYDLGDVVRSLPMNFSGGQNPSVALGASGGSISNQNITGGSSVNLRGLGPDATLTLFNGNRIAYDSFTQAVDISAIPAAAVDRIEIVPDGASALYGSDAVGGVVNVILRQDYDGLGASARVGAATEGGDFQQQYNVVAGKTWNSGGFIATYNYEIDTAITSDQRNYTTYMPQPNSLLPGSLQNAVVISGHQDIDSFATFHVDAFYNARSSFEDQTLASTDMSTNRMSAVSYAVAPSFEVQLPLDWRATLTGVYSQDRAFSDSYDVTTPGGTVLSHIRLCYCNELSSIELGGEGAIFALPAGEIRAAIGAGYRQNKFEMYYTTSSSQTNGQRHSFYEYLELNIPLVSEKQQIPLVHKLALDAAVRHEDYSDFGSISTPKVGLVYTIAEALSVKGSWGESFKAPTLVQEYASPYAELFLAPVLGGAGYPAGSTALLAYGSNRNLSPERATTWSTTVSADLPWISGLHADLSYFHIHYGDRVVQPLGALPFTALSNPVFQPYVTYNPTVAQQQAVIAAASAGLENYSGAAYDPANVVALVDDRYLNAMVQRIEGVDTSVQYRMPLGAGDLLVSEDGSWLFSEQQTSLLAPKQSLAGTIYNPPNFRSRTGVVWTCEGFTASGYLNYIGGVTNTGISPATKGDGMATADIVVGWRPEFDSAYWTNIAFNLAVQNITDTHPPYLANTSSYIVNYDSTNYSPIGRLVSVQISKQW